MYDGLFNECPKWSALTLYLTYGTILFRHKGYFQCLLGVQTVFDAWGAPSDSMGCVLMTHWMRRKGLRTVFLKKVSLLFGYVGFFTYIYGMKHLNIKEAAGLHEALVATKETEMPLVDFIQNYVDQYKDDWHMYRPMVENLEQRVTELENKLNGNENYT